MARIESQTGDESSTPGKALPVRRLRRFTGQPLQDDASPVEVRGSQAWRALLHASLRVLTPDNTGYGTCVDFLQRHELFLYRDENDTLVSVPLVFKPADIKVERSYAFADLLEVMAQQLRAEDPPGEHLLFETGDDSEYGYPFVYADTQSGLVLFLQREAVDQASAGDLPLGTTLEMLTRTVIDHIQVVFNQPVTSIARLFTMVSVSTADLARPTPLTLVKYDPIPPLNTAGGMDLVQWETRLDEITGTSPSSGRLRYLVDGMKFFPRMIDLVSNARESVDLRIYIFDDDDYATTIADLLKRRSTAIDVRVLVDGLGTLGASIKRYTGNNKNSDWPEETLIHSKEPLINSIHQSRVHFVHHKTTAYMSFMVHEVHPAIKRPPVDPGVHSAPCPGPLNESFAVCRMVDIGLVLLHNPVVGTVCFHPGNRLVETRNDDRMVGVFSAHPDIDPPPRQGFCKDFQPCHTEWHRLVERVTQHAIIIQRKVDLTLDQLLQIGCQAAGRDSVDVNGFIKIFFIGVILHDTNGQRVEIFKAGVVERRVFSFNEMDRRLQIRLTEIEVLVTIHCVPRRGENIINAGLAAIQYLL